MHIRHIFLLSLLLLSFVGMGATAERVVVTSGLLSQAFVNRPVAGSSDNIEDLLYDDQCDMMALVMKSNYEYFDLPYNGQNRHDLNGAMVGTQPRGGSSGARYYWMLAGTEDTDSDGGDGGDGPSGAPRRGNKVDGEGNRYYYHSDHLGSSMLITDESGNVTQQLDYLPYGEVFLEKRKQDPDVDYFTPYKFNGKELDEETGLYYYGARYMNPRLSIWYATDPLQEKYPSISSYTYCAGNPVNMLDTDGQKILFVNGYWISGYLGKKIGSEAPKERYWGDGFAYEAQSFFKDYSQINHTNYIDGSSLWGGDMSGGDRYDAGYQFAKNHISELTLGLKEGECFNVVTHSEGSAYGAGIAQYLIDAGYKVDAILHLSADEGDEFTTPKSPYTLQLSYEGDWVTNNHIIRNVDKVGVVMKGDLGWDQVHGITKGKSVFKAASDLRKVQIQDNIGMLRGRSMSWKSQRKGTTSNGTNFYSINGYILMNENGTKK